jgi:hypothetical protein
LLSLIRDALRAWRGLLLKEAALLKRREYLPWLNACAGSENAGRHSQPPLWAGALIMIRCRLPKECRYSSETFVGKV